MGLGGGFLVGNGRFMGRWGWSRLKLCMYLRLLTLRKLFIWFSSNLRIFVCVYVYWQLVVFDIWLRLVLFYLRSVPFDISLGKMCQRPFKRGAGVGFGGFFFCGLLLVRDDVGRRMCVFCCGLWVYICLAVVLFKCVLVWLIVIFWLWKLGAGRWLGIWNETWVRAIWVGWRWWQR